MPADAAPIAAPGANTAAADAGAYDATYDEEEEEDEEPWEQQLADALAMAGPPVAFAFSGTMEKVPAFAPTVTVEGLGRLVLPLCAEQAAALKAVAEPAPFGRGTETVVDETVRRVRQVPAARVTLGPASWAAALAHNVARAAAALGIKDAAALGVAAQLDKLVLYEPGGHFAPHKDTEKAAGMFGTLVVQLPCEGGHSGGELVIRHQERRVRVNFAAGSTRDGLPFAAFYADCTHELKPVTSGLRLALLFNLVRTTPGAPPAPVDSSAADAALRAAASAWAVAGADTRLRIALPLEHKYTPDSVSFSSLKGRDAAMARALLNCPLLDVRLALVDKVLTGTAEGPGSYNDVDDDDYCGAGDVHMGDVDSMELETVDWIAPPGRPALELDGVCEDDLLEESDVLLDDEIGHPDEQEYEEYQGNYAGTLTNTYHITVAVVSWLAANTHEVSTLESVEDAVAQLEAVHVGASAVALLADICSTAAKEPSKVTTPLVTRLLTLLPRISDAVAARAAGVQMIDALACWRVRLDAVAASAVAAFVAVNAADAAILASLRRLSRRAAASDVSSAVALVAALSDTPAAQAQAFADLAALVDDASALAKVSVASLPHLLAALLGAERYEVAPTETCQLGLHFIAALNTTHGIPDDAVAAALIAHAGRVACGDTDDALVSLVRANAGKQLAGCVALGKHAASSPQLRIRILDTLVALVDDAAAFAALREPNVTALCSMLLSEPGREGQASRLLAALASSPHGFVSATVSAAISDFALRMACTDVDAAVVALMQTHALRQLPAALALVLALAPPRAPALFAASLSALMVGVTGDAASFGALPDASFMKLAELAFSPEASSLGAGEALAAAVLAGPGAEVRIQMLLKTSRVRVAARRDAGAACLIVARISQLEAATAGGPPAHSWAQPGATLPADAAVEAFLRGPEERHIFRARFSGISAARQCVDSHFGRGSYRGSAAQRTYDATAEAGGTGRSAFVVVKKSTGPHESRVRAHAAALAELDELRAMLPAEQPVAGGAQSA